MSLNNKTQVEMTHIQAMHVERLLQYWKSWGETEHGEFDMMDFIARNNGWLPLEINEDMSVGYFGKRFLIKRMEDDK